MENSPFGACPDRQQERPAGYCPRCGGELWEGETVFDWEGAGFVCLDCFQYAAERLLRRDPCLAAAEMGVEYRPVGTAWREERLK